MSEVFAGYYQFKQYKFSDIQSCLNKDEAAIEVIRFRLYNKRWTDTVLYAVLILKPAKDAKTDGFSKSIEMVLLDKGNELEQLHIKNYKNCIKNKIPDNESYNQFWAKIAAKLKGIKKAYISPDGVYNQLNLVSLYNPKSKKYLIEELEIKLVTSTRDISENKNISVSENNKSAVLIGNPQFNMSKADYKKVSINLDNNAMTDNIFGVEEILAMRSGIHPLPGTGVEIDNISQLLALNNWKTEKYTGIMALEEIVKNVHNPRILHIATHGKFMSDIEQEVSNPALEQDKQRYSENPLLRSYLIFAGAEKPASSEGGTGQQYDVQTDDGFLTAYEAQNLYLDKTELVVLSACETGLGEIKNGEGVYGLQRAFIQAGAKSIIMSLWSVSDEATQELMTSFYTKWLSGKQKRQAFKEAQLELKAKYPMPYYWGAFVMVGD